MYGRQPTSHIDAKITKHRQDATVKEPKDHLERQMKKEALYQLARENDATARHLARVQYDKSKKRSSVHEGDLVFLRNEARSDSLDPKFKGPYRVL